MKVGKMRLLVSVLIIALFAVSWYTMISDAIEKEATYNAYLQTARDKHAKDLIEDAHDYYLVTLSLRDTIELRMEIADFYQKEMSDEAYLEYCEEIMKAYPYEPAIYDRLCTYYRERDNYYSCYSVINIATKRGISSEIMTAAYNELAYEYRLGKLGVQEIGDYSEGICVAVRQDGICGYINNAGGTVISFEYSKARSVGSGLAAVWNRDGEFSLINTEGRPKSKDSQKRAIEDSTMMSAGLIALKYDGKYHYCDQELTEKFGAYDFAGVFSDGVAAVANDGQWSIINTTGAAVSKNVFEDIKVDALGIAFRNGRAFAKINGRYIMIDTQGNQIGSETWEDARSFKSGQPAAVKKNGKWGFVDTSGNLVREYQYANAKSFTNNMAAVEINNAWGYIELSDYAVKIQPDFDDAMEFTTPGCAFVSKDGKWQLLSIYRLT